MTRRNLVIILSCFLSVLTLRAEVLWLETINDFGIIKEDDGKVACRFRFVNTSDEPVSILSSRASCGCTVPEYPHQSIQPGDTATINVTYNPAGRPGNFNKIVKIKLSDDSPTTSLKVSGTVVANDKTLRSRYPVDASPLKLRTAMLPFGEVSTLKSKAIFFEVYNASTDSVTPQWLDLPPYLRASIVSPVIPPGEQAAYALTLNPNKTENYGLFVDSIMLLPAPDAQPVAIDVVATIVEDFSHLSDAQLRNAPVAKLSTATIDMGQISPDTAINTSFSLSNESKDTLKIRRVYSSNPNLSIKVDKTNLKKGKSTKIHLSIHTSTLPSELLDVYVTIITNDPDNPQQTVRLVGYF